MGLPAKGGLESGGGGGGGTVTSVSVTTANGVSGAVATATTTPAITLTLGAITPSSIVTPGTTTALEFISTQVAGSDGVLLNTAGARVHFSSGGASDFLQGDGTDTVSAGGAAGAGSAKLFSAGVFAQAAAASKLGCRNNGSPCFLVDADLNIITLASGAVLKVGDGTTGSFLQMATKSDTTAAPGAFATGATCGRAAIAAGASSVVGTIANMLSTSLVFFTMLGVDATGLLPRISNIAAGSFTLTVAANCTGNLSFQWWVIL